MKTMLKSILALVVPVMLMTGSAQANPVELALTQIEELRALTLELDVTKAKDEGKVRRELIKYLDTATKEIKKGGDQHLYKAAVKVWDYCRKVDYLARKGKVDAAEAQVLIDMSLEVIDHLVEAYCPTCVYP